MTPKAASIVCHSGLHEWHLVRQYVGQESFPIARAEEIRNGQGQTIIHSVPCRRADGKHVFKAPPVMNAFCKSERSNDQYVEIVATFLKCANCDKEIDTVFENVEFQ